MKINTKKSIVNLDKKAIPFGDSGKDFTVGNALSNILSNAKTKDKMKFWILAQKCYEQDSVEIDDADLKQVEKAIEDTEIYNNSVCGQILVELQKKEK